jgi:hypothetical protein
MKSRSIIIGSKIRTAMLFSDIRLMLRGYDEQFARMRAMVNVSGVDLTPTQYEAVIAAVTECEKTLDQVLKSLETVTKQ